MDKRAIQLLKFTDLNLYVSQAMYFDPITVRQYRDEVSNVFPDIFIAECNIRDAYLLHARCCRELYELYREAIRIFGTTIMCDIRVETLAQLYNFLCVNQIIIPHWRFVMFVDYQIKMSPNRAAQINWLAVRTQWSNVPHAAEWDLRQVEEAKSEEEEPPKETIIDTWSDDDSYFIKRSVDRGIDDPRAGRKKNKFRYNFVKKINEIQKVEESVSKVEESVSKDVEENVEEVVEEVASKVEEVASKVEEVASKVEECASKVEECASKVEEVVEESVEKVEEPAMSLELIEASFPPIVEEEFKKVVSRKKQPRNKSKKVKAKVVPVKIKVDNDDVISSEDEDEILERMRGKAETKKAEVVKAEKKAEKGKKKKSRAKREKRVDEDEDEDEDDKLLDDAVALAKKEKEIYDKEHKDCIAAKIPFYFVLKDDELPNYLLAWYTYVDKVVENVPKYLKLVDDYVIDSHLEMAQTDLFYQALLSYKQFFNTSIFIGGIEYRRAEVVIDDHRIGERLKMAYDFNKWNQGIKEYFYPKYKLDEDIVYNRMACMLGGQIGANMLFFAAIWKLKAIDCQCRRHGRKLQPIQAMIRKASETYKEIYESKSVGDQVLISLFRSFTKVIWRAKYHFFKRDLEYADDYDFLFSASDPSIKTEDEAGDYYSIQNLPFEKILIYLEMYYSAKRCFNILGTKEVEVFNACALEQIQQCCVLYHACLQETSEPSTFERFHWYFIRIVSKVECELEILRRVSLNDEGVIMGSEYLLESCGWNFFGYDLIGYYEMVLQGLYSKIQKHRARIEHILDALGSTTLYFKRNMNSMLQVSSICSSFIIKFFTNRKFFEKSPPDDIEIVTSTHDKITRVHDTITKMIYENRWEKQHDKFLEMFNFFMFHINQFNEAIKPVYEALHKVNQGSVLMVVTKSEEKEEEAHFNAEDLD